jgi:hypothetical protein
MTRDDVIDVLTAVAAADRRTVGHADVDVWQGVIGDLPRDFALRAVRDHLRESPGVWLEPGHVFQRVRVIMREELEREPDTLREARQTALAAKVKQDEPSAPFTGPIKHHRPQNNWMAVRCPHCGAAPLKHCNVPGTPFRPHGGTHPARLQAARDRETELRAEPAHSMAGDD